ncbi:MAG: hypothetical protein RR826_03485 [Christensenellaceae bacterium]
MPKKDSKQEKTVIQLNESLKMAEYAANLSAYLHQETMRSEATL